ncbi:mannosyltransferase putative-domain-containing protein [Geopyxis carbonaria]|nr:mannosyltransferase putative-domain-containing protein [Geopyxis carbonaria]
MLRRTGCTLPAEVFLGTSAEYEPDVCEGVLPLLNARCVVIPDLFTTSVYVSVSRYQLKALALLFSSFAQVVFMDSDSIPLLDPTPLLSSAPFTDTGLVLWPDFWTATEDPAFWTIAGLGTEFPADLPATSSEAGQILIDKHRQLHALLLAVYYNVHGPDHYYPLLSQGALGQGDKETFLAAAVAAKAPWYRVRAPVLAVGYERRDGTLKGAGMAQAHPGDDLRVNGGGGGVAGVATREGVRTAWVHVNTPKMNAGHLVDEGDLVGEDGKRVRLLGSREKQVQLFGEDVERVLWEIMVDSGCELAMVVKEWVGRERMCERLKEHWEAVFEHHGK